VPPENLPEVIRRQLRQDRILATLAAFFALLSLALGDIGIYEIVAYRVSRRTAKMGSGCLSGRRDVMSCGW